VSIPDSETEKEHYTKEKVSELQEAEELSGKLSKQKEEDKLMSSVIEGDKEKIDNGKLINESINQNLSSFVPDMMYRNMINNFRNAKQIYGERIIRKLTGYDPSFIEKNAKIPEFQEEVKNRIEENVKKLKKEGILGKDGEVTDKGVRLGSVVMYAQELDKLNLRGLGERKEKKKDLSGEKTYIKPYHKSRYKDIAIRDTVKTAIRRGHTELKREDIRMWQREKKGGISLIYAVDASGSMKGQKISSAKKAGVALSYKAINEKNKVGLIVFGEKVKKAIEPTYDFNEILREITTVKAKSETNFSKTIKKSVEMFGNTKETKHLILLSDAMPTKGAKPKQDTIEAAAIAREAGVTISIVGIQLDKEGEELAKEVTNISQGRLYKVKDLGEMDSVILEDYYSL
jgi:Mg-chelatase subunit ChlD